LHAHSFGLPPRKGAEARLTPFAWRARLAARALP
jgi:hypothetical protein